MSTFFLLLASLATDAPPTWTKEYVDYSNCLVAKSAALEESEAPFDEIFAVAKDQCADGWFKLYAVLLPVVADFVGKYKEMPSERRAIVFIQELEDAPLSQARTIVLRMRTERKRRENARNQ